MTRRLNRALATSAAIQSRPDLAPPPLALLDLPERIVQFGTGALLRGLVDAMIDDANRAGAYAGRIVAIGSTGSGRDEVINEQDGLFTLRIEGIERGWPVRHHRLIGSVSRAVSAVNQWDEVLRCARNPLLDVVFSNTTEVGIVLDDNDLRTAPAIPASFPGKLTRFLYERARTFAYARDKGVVIVPCELIEDNGPKLRDAVLTLGKAWNLGLAFDSWLRESVHFCNTLVDRIVPGLPVGAELAQAEDELGFSDALLTVCEPYRLLVIETPHVTPPERAADMRQRLAFATTDVGALLVDSVVPYRARKVRLLNGAHTGMVSLALLAGCDTVRQAIEQPQVALFLRRAMHELVQTVSAPGAEEYAREVLERFANPYIRHQLRDIALHCGAKMRVRVVPAIHWHALRREVPTALTLGFAAYLLHAATAGRGGLPDDVGATIRSRWTGATDDAALRAFARAVTADTLLWETNLDDFPGFTESVATHLALLVRHGAVSTTAAALGTPRTEATPASV